MQDQKNENYAQKQRGETINTRNIATKKEEEKNRDNDVDIKTNDPQCTKTE